MGNNRFNFLLYLIYHGLFRLLPLSVLLAILSVEISYLRPLHKAKKRENTQKTSLNCVVKFDKTTSIVCI